MGLGRWVVACEHNIYPTYRPASDPVRRRWRAARRPTAQIPADLHKGTWGKRGLACPGKPFFASLQNREKISLWGHRDIMPRSLRSLSQLIKYYTYYANYISCSACETLCGEVSRGVVKNSCDVCDINLGHTRVTHSQPMCVIFVAKVR
jgi:hypothetical protein